MERIKRHSTLVLFLSILFLGIFLRLYGIAEQPPLGDEVEAAFSAVNYMENGQFGPTMWYHPNLRNIVLYWFGRNLDYGLYAMRGMSLLTGILSIPLVGLIAHVLTKNRMVVLLSMFLLAVDLPHITYSRQAIQETWTTFLFLLGIQLYLLYADRKQNWLLLCSGLVFGLGTASKFHALFPLAVCLGAGLYSSWRERSFAKGLFLCCSLILLPAAVFLLTYLPWFGRGYGVVDWAIMQKALLFKMRTHQGNPADQIIETAAWQWFLRPMGYANFVIYEKKPYLTVAYSNLFVWLLVIPATVSQLVQVIRKWIAEEEVCGTAFILLLFLASYVPLAVASRPIYLLSSLAAIPFAFILVALAVTDWIGNIAWRKRVFVGYIAIILLTSMALYPLTTGKGKFYSYLDFITEKYRPVFESHP